MLLGMLAIAATAACNRQEEPAVEPKLDVDKAAVSVAATAGEATFNVTACKIIAQIIKYENHKISDGGLAAAGSCM